MSRYYLSEPVYHTPVSQIDRDNGIIRGVTVAKAGPARGHDGMLDNTFLLQLVEMANTRPQGIKARFGHPNMCSTALGTYLGRFRNYSFNGITVTADLYLDPSSKSSPNGNLFEYVLNMAETNPDMFGASLVFESAEFEVTDKVTDGKVNKIKFFRLKELRATDIVDDPAATDGLFSAETFPGQATTFLDQNPELTELIFSKPDSVIEFFNSYLNNSNMNLSDKIIENFKQMFGAKPSPISPVTEVAEVTPTLLETAFTKLQSLGVISETEIPSELEAKTALVIEAFEQTLAKLVDAENQISLLNTKLSAKPTIPANVSDPQISVNLSTQDKDEAGKEIIKNLPADLRHKFRMRSKQ